ncbi:MAG: flagellar basal body protein [Parvularculaceae bacterium]
MRYRAFHPRSTGVAGLAVNAVKLATISDNIANSQTVGFKRADTEFADIVLQQQSGAYSAGGVRGDDLSRRRRAAR